MVDKITIEEMRKRLGYTEDIPDDVVSGRYQLLIDTHGSYEAYIELNNATKIDFNIDLD
jgi:hypothetical protein